MPPFEESGVYWFEHVGWLVCPSIALKLVWLLTWERLDLQNSNLVRGLWPEN